MENNYNEDKIKNILNNPPEFDLPEGALDAMRQKLDAQAAPAPPKRAFPFWWFFSLLLPLFLGGIYLLFQNLQMSQQITQLHEQIKSVATVDTQINTRVIYQYDTIVNTVYKNILIEEILQNQPYNPSNSAFATVNAKTFDTNFLVPRIRSGSYSNLFTEKSPLEAAFLRQGIGLQLLNANLPDEVSEEEQSAFLSEMLADIQALDYPALNALDPPLVNRHYINYLTPGEPAYRKIKKNPIFYFIPTGASAGITGTPLVLPNTSLNFESTYTLGLNASLHFINDVSLTLGAEYLPYRFEYSPEEFDDGIFSVAPPNEPDDELHEIKGSFNYLQFPLQLKKYLRSGKKFQPYFGLGMVAYLPIKQSVSFEYIDGGNEYAVSSNFGNGDFSTSNLRVNLGAQWTIWDNFVAQIEPYYQHGFKQSDNEFFKIRNWGLQMGVSYRWNQ